MAINPEFSFDVDENGISLKDNDGIVILYVTGGVGSPVGTQAPVPTIYVDENATLWRKFGPLATDWTEVESDRNLDGGFANSVFKPSECFDGGDANG